MQWEGKGLGVGLERIKGLELEGLEGTVSGGGRESGNGVPQRGISEDRSGRPKASPAALQSSPGYVSDNPPMGISDVSEARISDVSEARRSPVGGVSEVHRLRVGLRVSRVSVMKRRRVGRVSVVCRRRVGRVSVVCRRRVGRVSVACRLCVGCVSEACRSCVGCVSEACRSCIGPLSLTDTP